MISDDSNSRRPPPPVGLTVPEQAPAQLNSFLKSSRAMRRWVEELPTANVGETARQVYKTLVTFNRTQIPTLTRAEIVELFREPVSHVITNIRKHYYQRGFPLPAKGLKAARLAAALCGELANAYKILFLDQILGDERSFNQKLIIVAAQRAIQYLDQQMFQHLLTYRDYPKGLWREANYLYAWAIQNEVAEVQVREESGSRWGKKRTKSIDQVYKAMVLMATTNPNGFRQSHLAKLHRRMAEWALLIQTSPAYEVRGSTGLFFINLWADSPPQHSLQNGQRRDSRYLAFDLNPVLDEARAIFDQARWEAPGHLDQDENQLSRTLLKPLIQHWSKASERRFPRSEDQGHIEVLPGFSNLLKYLEAQEQARQEEEAPSEEEVAESQPASNLTWNDSVFSSLAINSPVSNAGGDSNFSDSLNLASTLIGSLDEPDPSTLINEPPKKRETPRPFTALTFNRSVGGYCLAWRENAPMRIRVGDVLGIQPFDDAAHMGIGITRWLRQHKEGEVVIGLQRLSNRCTLVRLAPENEPENHCPALLLANDDPEPDGGQLLLDTTRFAMDAPLILKTPSDRHRIHLSRWLESNNNFVHYGFDYLERPEAATASGETDGFDELWSEL